MNGKKLHITNASIGLTIARIKHFVINAAPGAGKTICASVIAQSLLRMGKIERVIIIAPRAEVVRQWSDEFFAVTQRHMTKVTGADAQIEDFGDDLCATWSAIQTLADGFQAVCRAHKTLVICDEHHHAAVSLPGEIRLIQHSKRRAMFLC